MTAPGGGISRDLDDPDRDDVGEWWSLLAAWFALRSRTGWSAGGIRIALGERDLAAAQNILRTLERAEDGR